MSNGEGPYSAESERAVISAWFTDDAFALAWRPDPTLFSDLKYQKIVAAMESLDPRTRDETALIVTLERARFLHEVGGSQAIFRIINAAFEYKDPWTHLATITEARALRALTASTRRALAEVERKPDLAVFAVGLETGLKQVIADLGAKVLSVKDILELALKTGMEPRQQAQCPTGLDDFDADTGGLRKKFVTVLGASTNWGKSSLLVMFADESLAAGRRVLLVSYEDDEELYGRRLLARRSRVSAANLRTGTLMADEVSRAREVVLAASPEPFFLNAIGRPVERVASEIRSMCAAESIDLVIVDYLQAAPVRDQQQDRRNEVTYIARSFTDAIKISGAAGLLVSQLKRGVKKGQKPTMFDLKESGDVENAADLVILGWTNQESGLDVPTLSVEKNKDGMRDVEYALQWDPTACCFEARANGRREQQREQAEHSGVLDDYRYGD